MEKNKKNYVSRHLIMGTSRATRGAYVGSMELQHSSDPNATRANIIIALQKTSWFERLWYPIFFLSGIFCLIFIRPFNFELCFSVFSLFIYMVANNLIARGKLLGIVFSICSAALYVIVSFFAKVYGEVIINLLLYIPLDVIAIITFKKNSSKVSEGDVEIKKFSVSSALVSLLATIAITGVCFVILYFLPGQVYPLLNSLSISLFLMALIVRNMRYKEFWFFDLFGNLVSLVMWGVVATSSAKLLYGLPIALSSLAALLNNIYGIIMWQKIYRREKTNGKIFVKKNVKINHVIKLRRRYNDVMKWDKIAEEKKAKRAGSNYGK